MIMIVMCDNDHGWYCHCDNDHVVLSCVIMIMGGIVMCDNDHGWYCHV